MARTFCILSLLLVLIGCGQKEATMNDIVTIKSAEDGIK